VIAPLLIAGREFGPVLYTIRELFGFLQTPKPTVVEVDVSSAHPAVATLYSALVFILVFHSDSFRGILSRAYRLIQNQTSSFHAMSPLTIININLSSAVRGAGGGVG